MDLSYERRLWEQELEQEQELEAGVPSLAALAALAPLAPLAPPPQAPSLSSQLGKCGRRYLDEEEGEDADDDECCSLWSARKRAQGPPACASRSLMPEEDEELCVTQDDEGGDSSEAPLTELYLGDWGVTREGGSAGINGDGTQLAGGDPSDPPLYAGEFVAGQYEGRGTLFHRGGGPAPMVAVYGTFRAGQAHGPLVRTFTARGLPLYVGAMANGVQHGRGQETVYGGADGATPVERYEGAFVSGARTEGALYKPVPPAPAAERSVAGNWYLHYAGAFAAGQPQGQGTLHEWVPELGRGVAVYTGAVQRGLPEGQGTRRYPADAPSLQLPEVGSADVPVTEVSGVWKDGAPGGAMVLHWNDGVRFEGALASLSPLNGTGALHQPAPEDGSGPAWTTHGSMVAGRMTGACERVEAYASGVQLRLRGSIPAGSTTEWFVGEVLATNPAGEHVMTLHFDAAGEVVRLSKLRGGRRQYEGDGYLDALGCGVAHGRGVAFRDDLPHVEGDFADGELAQLQTLYDEAGRCLWRRLGAAVGLAPAHAWVDAAQRWPVLHGSGEVLDEGGEAVLYRAQWRLGRLERPAAVLKSLPAVPAAPGRELQDVLHMVDDFRTEGGGCVLLGQPPETVTQAAHPTAAHVTSLQSLQHLARLPGPLVHPITRALLLRMRRVRLL